MLLQTNLYRQNRWGSVKKSPLCQNIRQTPLLCLIVLVVLSCFYKTALAQTNERWQTLSPGVEYQDLEGGLLTPWSHIHVFRVDLKNNKLESVTAKNIGMNNASVDQISERTRALLGINGGFFDKQFRPLGLRISNKQQLSPLKRISWWGIFYIKNKVPKIASLRTFEQDTDIEFAVQSGPRLLINGKIPSLKVGSADRSALGITAEGKVILLVSTNAAMSTYELARFMKSPPLNCVNAINLDGGSSSQLYAHIRNFQLNVRGFSNISDAVTVSARRY